MAECPSLYVFFTWVSRIKPYIYILYVFQPVLADALADKMRCPALALHRLSRCVLRRCDRPCFLLSGEPGFWLDRFLSPSLCALQNVQSINDRQGLLLLSVLRMLRLAGVPGAAIFQYAMHLSRQ
ncbi:hypothetical protein BAV3250 [Bordetella avium 197N]|uniref:Uncharacterized protein n=1 Tax=Bordetella avium (strain 197N) TaxID=360910 RepID=Q2KU00_BORA1|nr:hypothetical protein BAV3250 [Bordetella avium 197N]